MALVFTKEVEKLLVILRWHVEVRDQHLVIPAGVFQSQADQFTHIVAGQVANV